ncbi:MAG: hypothetical protein ACJAYU_002142 [Bradymonadia bacterium]
MPPRTPTTDQPQRIVHCKDAIPWLEEHGPVEGASVITSLPDVSGLPKLSLDEWKAWFVGAAERCVNATPDDGVTIFYQTDIKVDGVWVDKGYLCHKAAEAAGAEMLWHKIFCRCELGEPAYGRPGYTHLLCFSRGVRDVVARSYPDVFSSTGEMTWSRAMGLDACDLACRYVQSHTNSLTILDPFCGKGSVLAAANKRGLDAVGVEVSKRRARKARGLTL